MLLQVTTVHNNSLEQLFSVYEESMKDLQSRYASLEDMKASYADFLNEFLSIPNQYVLVEAAEGQWVSGLRAIETESGCWFLEAVETMPEERRKGHGRRLLLHTLDFLKSRGMQQAFCQISKNNIKSQKLHISCGFIPTEDPSIDPWGQLNDRTILFRHVTSSLSEDNTI